LYTIAANATVKLADYICAKGS